MLTFLVHFRQFCHTDACVWDGTCIKGRGGGQGRKFFLVILIANLVYFHPLFTEFENSDPLTPKLADLLGLVEAPGGDFWSCREIR